MMNSTRIALGHQAGLLMLVLGCGSSPETDFIAESATKDDAEWLTDLAEWSAEGDEEASLLLAVASRTTALDATSKANAVKLILKNSEKMIKYARMAGKYLPGTLKYAKYLAKSLSYASKISEQLNDIMQNRDRNAEAAFGHGWDHGVRDARFMMNYPGEAFIDINWRSFYRQMGSRYEAAYLGGWAAGWRNELE